MGKFWHIGYLMAVVCVLLGLSGFSFHILHSLFWYVVIGLFIVSGSSFVLYLLFELEKEET